MPTVECRYLVTSLPPSSQHVSAHACTDTYFSPPPSSSLHQDPGRLTPPRTHDSPLHSPFPSSLSTPTDPLSDGPLFTFTLLHGPAGPGGRPNRYIIVWSSLATPAPPRGPLLPCQPGLTPFTVLKSTICITQQSGSGREGEMGQGGQRKQGGEKGDDGRGGREGRGAGARGI